MTLGNLDQILEDAFSFLVTDCGYSAQPARSGGGRFGSGITKVFAKDRQTITLLIGDADSRSFCSVFFSDGDDTQVEPMRRYFRHRCLEFLLQRKGIDVDLPDKGNFAHEAEAKETLYTHGKVVKEHALDVVSGDFSTFPQLVYVVQHVDRHYLGGEVRRLIGVYSSFDKATEAISERRIKPGFVLRQDGFEVHCFELDQGIWSTGIDIAPSTQATEFFMRVLRATSLAEFNTDEQRQIEAQWLARFAALQQQYEVSRVKAFSSNDPERAAVLARYPRDHFAWSVALDEAALHRARTVFVDELKGRPIGLECWTRARESGTLSPRFVSFIDEELR